ncbi:MAG TPA: hypothetical protein VGS07_26335 [Thermoanaerobaculia bacterium]|nr:hypothetical protein [Thermoanaerobaculia bacterium]
MGHVHVAGPQLQARRLHALLARVPPVDHPLDADLIGRRAHRQPGAQQVIAFPVLQDEGLAGAGVSREQVFGQAIHLVPLGRRFLGSEAVGELDERRRRDHQDDGGEGLCEKLLKVGPLDDLDHVGRERQPVGVEAVEHVHLAGIDEDFDHPRAQVQNLASALVQVILVGKVVLAAGVGHSEDVADLDRPRRRQEGQTEEDRGPGEAPWRL